MQWISTLRTRLAGGIRVDPEAIEETYSFGSDNGVSVFLHLGSEPISRDRP